MYRAVELILAGWLLLPAAPLRAGVIEGSVSGVSRALPAVVYVTGVRAGVPSNGKAALDQRNQQFVPRVLPILLGTRVEFPNSDHVLHNVYSFWHGKRFDLGLYPPGAKQKGVLFDKPGVHAVFCNIHSNMSAYIVVLENPYFATTDSKGRFRITGVPPGSYSLRVWHPSRERTGSVVVPKEGSATVEFKL